MFKAEIFRQCRSTALQKNHSPIAIRYSPPFCHSLLSPFAAFLPVASRYSPFAAVFPDLPICRPHDLPKTRLGRSLALPLNSVLRSAL
jgi:hypothetical protein